MTSLESRRKVAKASGLLLFVPQILMLLFVFDVMPWHPSQGALFGLWFGTMLIAAVTAVVFSERYKSSYKKDVVAPLIKQVDPSAVYEPEARLDPVVLEATGLFPRASDQHSDNRVRGHLNGVPFQFSSVHLSRTTTHNDQEERETVFRGLFLQIALPYTVNGVTCLMSDGAEPRAPRALRGELTKVDLGLGARFDAQFDVWASSPTDAKAILTPDLAARLAEHGEDSDYPPRLSFHDGFLSVAVDCGDVLQASLTGGQEGARATAFEVDGIFGLARGLIEILQVQAPRFAARPVATLGSASMPEDVADAASTDATAAAAVMAVTSPWDQHGRAKPTGDLRQIAEKVRGAGVGVDLEGSSTMTLQYGLRPGLFYALFMGLLWTAVALNVAGVATGTPPEGSPLRLTTTFPALNGVAAWLAQYHPVATAIALVAGLISLSSTLMHVRRATLTRSGVEMVRAVWPVPRRQAIDPAAPPSVSFVQRSGVFVGSMRVSPPLPYDTGAVVAHSVASFFGVEASIPIEEANVKFTSDLRVGRKRYFSSNR